MSYLSLLPDTYNNDALYRIQHSGRVSQEKFETIAGFFCAIAGLAFLGRLLVRITIRQRLYIDDYLLILAACGLAAATGILYRFSHMIFVLNALKYDPSILPTKADLENIGNAQAISYSLIAMICTGICSTKLCFLASFKILIRGVSKGMNIWFWITVTLSIIQWILGSITGFIVCPYVGAALLEHCAPDTPYVKTMAFIILFTCLDFLTDVMIISIPIWILRTVNIRLTQKFAIGIFLCLSVVTMIVGILRMTMAHHDGFWDTAWQFLVMYLESCIAVTMASVAAFRSIFVERQRRRQQSDQLQPDTPADNLRVRIAKWRAQAREEARSEDGVREPAMTHRSFLPRFRFEGPRLKGLSEFSTTLRSSSAADTRSKDAMELSLMSQDRDYRSSGT